MLTFKSLTGIGEYVWCTSSSIGACVFQRQKEWKGLLIFNYVFIKNRVKQQSAYHYCGYDGISFSSKHLAHFLERIIWWNGSIMLIFTLPQIIQSGHKTLSSHMPREKCSCGRLSATSSKYQGSLALRDSIFGQIISLPLPKEPSRQQKLNNKWYMKNTTNQQLSSFEPCEQ